MTTDERLGRIEERLKAIEKAVLSNGQPGLIQRVTSLELWRSGHTAVLGLLAILLSAGVLIPAIKAALR